MIRKQGLVFESVQIQATILLIQRVGYRKFSDKFYPFQIAAAAYLITDVSDEARPYIRRSNGA